MPKAKPVKKVPQQSAKKAPAKAEKQPAKKTEQAEATRKKRPPSNPFTGSKNPRLDKLDRR